jgi:hypothetical protein
MVDVAIEVHPEIKALLENTSFSRTITVHCMKQIVIF